jgi:type III secretory pathway component EscS
MSWILVAIAILVCVALTQALVWIGERSLGTMFLIIYSPFIVGALWLANEIAKQLLRQAGYQ